MQIQSIPNNNQPASGALILGKNMKSFLNQISKRDLEEIHKTGERLKNTKYYDLYVQNNYDIDCIEPCFIPKTNFGVRLAGTIDEYTSKLSKDENGHKTKLDWLKSSIDSERRIATFDFQSSADAIKAKKTMNRAEIDVETDPDYEYDDDDYYIRHGITNLSRAIKAWGNVCLEVLEKSMAFKESGKPKVLNASEKLVEDLMSTKKDEINREAIKILNNYFRKNPDYGNLYTAGDMLELLRCMGEEDILYKKDILTTPIKKGDSSILMYVADIFPTEENAKQYDKIINILKKVQGINYNYKDKSNVSFLEKVMMSENFKLLELIKDKPLEYYPELDYVYENIQNPNFKEGVNKLNIVLKNTDGLTAKDIKSELQSIAFQNTVKGK